MTASSTKSKVAVGGAAAAGAGATAAATRRCSTAAGAERGPTAEEESRDIAEDGARQDDHLRKE